MAGPRPPAAPGPAPTARAYLRARPAKQGEGELADRDRHQVHAHGPPMGAPCFGPWGMWQAENAETPLKGVHGVAVPGPARGIFGVAVVVLVVQDKALRAEQVWPQLRGRARAETRVPQSSQPRQSEPLTCLSRRRITWGRSPATRPSWGWLSSKSTSWPCNLPLRGHHQPV